MKLSFLKGLGKIGDVVGSTPFLEGLITGAGKEAIRQERVSEKKIENDLKEGRMSIRAALKKYNADLDASDKQVKQIANLLKGKRQANSKEALESTLFLIQEEGGVQNAYEKAKLLAKEYDKFGEDPFVSLGIKSVDREITASDISKTIVTKPITDFKFSKGSATALDKLGKYFFNKDFKTSGEIVSETLEKEFGEDDKKDTLVAFEGTGVRPNVLFKSTATKNDTRIQELRDILNNKQNYPNIFKLDALGGYVDTFENQEMTRRIKADINFFVDRKAQMAELEKDVTKITPTGRKRLTKVITQNAVISTGLLPADVNQLMNDGSYFNVSESADITAAVNQYGSNSVLKVMQAIRVQNDDINNSRTTEDSKTIVIEDFEINNNQYIFQDDPLALAETAAALGRNIEFIPATTEGDKAILRISRKHKNWFEHSEYNLNAAIQNDLKKRKNVVTMNNPPISVGGQGPTIPLPSLSDVKKDYQLGNQQQKSAAMQKIKQNPSFYGYTGRTNAELDAFLTN